MMQRWRGCGTLELARALAIGRSANHSFGNNRLHTLHTKDIHASLSKNRPDPGAASPPISTYDPETSSISPSTNPLSSLFHFRFQDPIQTSLPFRLQGKRNRLVPMYESLHDRWTITISPLRFYPTCFELDKFLYNGILPLFYSERSRLRNQRLDRADIVRETREPRELSVASIAAKRDARPRFQVEGYREGRNGE